MKTKKYEHPTTTVVELKMRGAVLLGMSTPDTTNVFISGDEANTPAQAPGFGRFDEDY